jgi:hypothetical protein
MADLSGNYIPKSTKCVKLGMDYLKDDTTISVNYERVQSTNNKAHSDYITKEFSTLIMLNSDANNDYLKTIATFFDIFFNLRINSTFFSTGRG